MTQKKEPDFINAFQNLTGRIIAYEIFRNLPPNKITCQESVGDGEHLFREVSSFLASASLFFQDKRIQERNNLQEIASKQLALVFPQGVHQNVHNLQGGRIFLIQHIIHLPNPGALAIRSVWFRPLELSSESITEPPTITDCTVHHFTALVSCVLSKGCRPGLVLGIKLRTMLLIS